MIDHYLRLRKRNKSLRMKTVEMYRYELGTYERLKDDINALEAHLDDCMPSTRARKLIVWKCYTAWLKDPRLDHLEVPPITHKKPPSYLNEIDIKKLLTQAEQETLDIQIFIGAGLKLGLRLGEILQLNSKSIREDSLELERKGGRVQLLPCPQELLDKLKGFKGFQFQELYYQLKLKEIAKRAGIEARVTPHVLRHSFATQAMRKNIALSKIQKFLGHNYLQTTCMYLHVDTEDLRELIK